MSGMLPGRPAKLGTGLTAAETKFIEAMAAGADMVSAYYSAGYSDCGKNVTREARRLLRRPHVAAAFHLELARLLNEDGALARSVAVEILRDPAVSPKIRADLAIKMLRLSGHVEPRAAPVDDAAGQRTLEELSIGELHQMARALEDEIAGRAKLVGSSSAAPAQVIEQPHDYAQ